MTTSPEGGYEDSAQKRERLLGEMMTASEELMHFLRLLRKDLKKESGSFGKFQATDDRMDRLVESEDSLRAELKDMVTKYDSMQPDDEGRDNLEKQIDEKREEIMRIWEQKNLLRDKEIRIMEENSGDQGDADGTMAIIEMKRQRINEIEQQLKELDQEI